jgi:hypothetical protein
LLIKTTRKTITGRSTLFQVPTCPFILNLYSSSIIVTRLRRRAVEGFFVVTATSVEETGSVDPTFMVRSGMPWERLRPIEEFGYVALLLPGPEHFNPFGIGRPGTRPEGLRRWHISIGTSSGLKSSASVDECPDKGEEGLADLLSDIHSPAVLLMEREVFDQFEIACKTAGIKLEVHHFEGKLSTSAVPALA